MIYTDNNAVYRYIKIFCLIIMLSALQLILCSCNSDSVSAQDIFDHYAEERATEDKVPETTGSEPSKPYPKSDAEVLLPESTDLADSVKHSASDIAGDIKETTEKTVQDTKQGAGNVLSWLIYGLEDSVSDFKAALLKPTGLTPHTDSEIPSETDPAGPDHVPTDVKAPPVDLSQIGPYDGNTCVVVNNNMPFFSDDDITTAPFELYSPLDGLGRCHTAFANICKDIMPTEERGDIGMIKPSGWNQQKYECLKSSDNPGGYLYNRCHLIAYCLAGENANPLNLITGTRHFNTYEGMESYELKVLDYVKGTGRHVLYRVTPAYRGDDLVAFGVLMEGMSVEDNGICFCVFVYNVQPGITIDYSNGENHESTTM